MIRLFAISALIIASCGESSGELTEDEKKIIISDVKQTLQNYSDDVRKTGLEAEFRYLDSSSDFSWVPPGYNSAISYDSVALILKQNAPIVKTINNIYEILKIVPIGKYQACYTARVVSNVTDAKGISTTSSLIETGVLIKRPAGWKLLSGQTSLLSNP